MIHLNIKSETWKVGNNNCNEPNIERAFVICEINVFCQLVVKHLSLVYDFFVPRSIRGFALTRQGINSMDNSAFQGQQNYIYFICK